MSLAKTARRLDMQGLMRGRVLDLYRRMCRQVPRMIALYEIPYTAQDMRHIIALLFKKNAHVRDPRLIDMLVSKGEMEMEETLMQWKQRPHVMALLQLDQAAIDAGGDGESVIDNQAWIAGLVEAAEAASGMPSGDHTRLAAIVEAARAMEMGGGMPGQALAPATDELTESYISLRKRGTKQLFDTVQAAYTGAEDENPMVKNTRTSDLPAELRQLKQLAYGERELTAAEEDEARVQTLKAFEVGKGPSVRPPAAVADAGLPLWIASKVHWPEAPAADARAAAADAAAIEESRAAHPTQEDFEAFLAAKMREVDADPLRFGRVR